MWPNWRLWTFIAVFLVISAIPIATYLAQDWQDRRAVDRIRKTLRRTGWTLVEGGSWGELWGRTLTPEQQRTCADDRFLLPPKPGPMMIERLERDLDCITDGAIPAGDPHPKPTGIIVIERPLTEDETAALRAAFIAKFGQAPQSGAENIKPDSETADQDGPT